MCRVKDCPLYGKTEVPYVGNRDSGIVYMGESPGYEEIKARPPRPFIGRAGGKGRSMSAEAGLSWNDFTILNSARCLINKKEMSDRDIQKTLKACRAHVCKALESFHPKCIILAGDYALRQIMGRKGITKARNERWLWSEEFNCWCKPTYHPAYILRNPALEKDAIKDLVDVKAFMDNGNKPRIQELTTDYKEVQSIQEYIKDAKLVAIDTEGQGLDWAHRDYVMLGYSLSVAPNTGVFVSLYREAKPGEVPEFVIQWERAEGRKQIPVDIGIIQEPNFKYKLSELWKLLGNPEIKKVMMNGNFDLHVINTTFMRVVQRKPKIESYVIDVQAGAHLLNENIYSMADLVSLQFAFTNRQDNYDLAFSKKYGKADMLSVPLKEVVPYASADTDITRQVALTIGHQIKKNPKLYNYLRKFVMPTLATLRQLEENGLPIDRSELPKVRDELEQKMREAQSQALVHVPAKVKQAHAIKNDKKKDCIVLTRKDFISDILYHQDGFHCKVERTTKTKKPSTDVDALKEIKGKYTSKKLNEFIDCFMQFAKYQKLWSTYFKGFDKHVKHDGCVHSHLSLVKTVTGRISSSSPNITNMPKRDVTAMYFRKMVKAPKGFKLLAVDESQAEIRWMGHMSLDKELLRIYNNTNLDVHTETAMEIARMTGKRWDMLTDGEKKSLRQKAKAICFGWLYGMLPKTFVNYAKDDYGLIVSLREAEQYQRLFYGKYKGIPEYHRKMINFCKINGYVETLFGRRRHLSQIRSEDGGERRHAENQAVNFPIQGASSDTVLIACNQLLGNSPLNMDVFRNNDTKTIYEKLQLNNRKDYGMLHPDNCKPCAFIHDELIFLVKDDSQLADYAKLIKFEMEHPPLERDFGIKLRVPLVAEMKIGDNLAEMKTFSIEE